MNKFSVSLGLFDYINPIFYTITAVTIISKMYLVMNIDYFLLLVSGCAISIIFGFAIPTIKLLVGLGKFEFKMPVNLVFYVNAGLLISGICLFDYIFEIKPLLMLVIVFIICMLLLFVYTKTKKFNTIAVLTGLIGYSLIYSSLINIAIKNNCILSIVLYSIAICLCVLLVIIGCTANLKDARVHWVIEITNVTCQGLVALSTVILFSTKFLRIF